MRRSKSPDTHIGSHIRSNVIPSGMSVTEAASRLGVGRPALSNLLNGKSALSSDMAARLEKAFGIKSADLMELASSLKRLAGGTRQDTLQVRAYVPNFLTIKARQIEAWSDGLEARQQLAVLLRRLIHSTGQQLQEVDFPGYDNAERKGPDGFVISEEATPWIPAGTSYWEFGVTKDAEAKAEKDYNARTKSVPATDVAKSHFVFVTTRNWPGKRDWSKDRSRGPWKSVRAYDASDLEQWLEESIPGQMWLAEKLNLPIDGFETLSSSWERWASACDPPMHSEIFQPSIVAHHEKLLNWLGKDPDQPFVVAADSRDEALAFLACVFAGEPARSKEADLAAIFHSPTTLRKLAGASSRFIPIVTTDDAERELGPIYRRLHCIAVRPRNSVSSEPDIALDLLSHESFEKALAAMGIDSGEFDRLARESGRSPTILRRRLSRVHAVRMPKWAEQADTARSLIPITLVGAWHATSKADCEIVGVLATGDYPVVEENVAKLRLFDDSPVWSIGQYHGIVSKIDALFAINQAITRSDLTRFFQVAKNVLSESDPALDLPEDERWMAGIYGKVRDHSAALRESLCETLVILAVHGNNLFRERLGLDLEASVGNLIEELLSPLSIEKLLSHDHDLPRYAEAAPEVFLSLIENDLRSPTPVILGLLRPAGPGLMTRCPRTGLLWSLESLAWKPENLSRVAAVLAQLSRTPIDDNWANKPTASLSAIFRSWMPQTAASVDDRIKALEMLIRRHPDVAWQICIEQFSPGSNLGFFSYRPRWRSDASGSGNVVTQGERYRFARHALDAALNWNAHDENTLGDLIERFGGMSVSDIDQTWELVRKWDASQPTEMARASLRERIRRFALGRRGRKLEGSIVHRARRAYESLEPRNVVIRHKWLFEKQWVEYSAEEVDLDAVSFEERASRIDELRLSAMREIWHARGFDGILGVLEGSEAAFTIGSYLNRVLTHSDASEVMQSCLSLAESSRNVDGFIQGFLASMKVEDRSNIFSTISSSSNRAQLCRVLRLGPFNSETWAELERFGEGVQQDYWQRVYPYWNRFNEAELMELVDRLLEVHRPRAAFAAVHLDWEKLETSRLKRLLLSVATENDEPQGHYKIDPHDLSEALTSLSRRTGITHDEMAELEFLFAEVLDHTQHGIPNLQRQIATNPGMFVQAVAMISDRDDNAEDPEEWRIDDPNRRAAVARLVYRLLSQLRRIPGTEEGGVVNATELTDWAMEARRLFTHHARTEHGDYWIGELLGRGPYEKDGTWPCKAICEVMEKIASDRLADGFYISVHNSRGVHWRGDGGSQERELALRYREYAKALSFEYPFVSSVLERIATGYDRHAEREDSDSKLRRRLHH